MSDFRKRLVSQSIKWIQKWASTNYRKLNPFHQVRYIAKPTTTSQEQPLPNFLIIGAQKSGTVWLNTNLRMHPDIFLPSYEVWFFNKKYEQGLNWYRTHFKGWDGESLIGETTPGYMMWREHPTTIAARIDSVLPEVRLISLLRNPIDRTYSAFLHHMRKGRIPTDANLIDRVRSIDPRHDQLGLIAGGWYAASLAPYVERFGDRLQVFLYDEIAKNPNYLYSQVLEHIGASTDFSPPGLSRARHKGEAPEKSQYYKEGKPRVLTSAERQELYEYFRQDIEQLEELLGRKLDFWYPPA